uniref:Uncharacterized protein n=1 Tax=Opuntia streptacantha TaxID=393608 RepID=A0A7C9B088_OPUST
MVHTRQPFCTIGAGPSGHVCINPDWIPAHKAQIKKKIGDHWGLLKAHNEGNWAEHFPAQPGAKRLGESTGGRVGWDHEFDPVRVRADFRDESRGQELGVFAEGGDDEVVARGGQRRRLGGGYGRFEGGDSGA